MQEIRNNQIKKETITGEKVKDESIEGKDIKDDTIDENELTPTIRFLLRFGKNKAYNISESLTQTTSTTFLDKLTLSVNITEAGTYRLGWCYSWFYSSIADSFEARIILDNDTVNLVMLHTEEPQDSNTDQRHWTSAFKWLELSVGAHIIKLQFRTKANLKTASIMAARFEFWRIS